jgi:hypothetical protein
VDPHFCVESLSKDLLMDLKFLKCDEDFSNALGICCILKYMNNVSKKTKKTEELMANACTLPNLQIRKRIEKFSPICK